MLARARRAAAVLAAAAVAAPVCGAWLPVAPAASARADQVRDAQRPILDDLDVPAAWKITRGRGVTVAVVDAGVVGSNPDLAGSVTIGPNMLAAIDAGTRPQQMHGTTMASLIAGHGHGPGGNAGVIGIAPEAKLLSVRVIGEKGDPSYRRFRTDERSETAVARGIRYAADHGADVINLSLGESRESAEEREAVGYAIGKGVVVVAAAGNEGEKRELLDGDGFAPYSYPASYPGVIAVAATDGAHARAPFSNRNYSVLLGAPGVDLPVSGSDGNYYRSSGTSDACALVSGIAALIRARHPKLPPALVSQALVAGTRSGPAGKYGPETGFGQVNAQRALAAADTLTSARPGAAAGKPARDRFGAAEPGPVAIIDRPGWVQPLIVTIIVVGVGGTLAAAAISVAFHRRHPRPALSPALSPGQVGAFGPPSFGRPGPGAPPYRPPSYMRQHGPAYPSPPPSGTPSFAPPGQDAPPSYDAPSGYDMPPPVPPREARPPGEHEESGDAGGSDGVVGT